MASKAIPTLFQHFEIPPNAEGNFKARCIHWNTYYSGSTKGISNLLIHLKVT